jgi:hypothetical protein
MDASRPRNVPRAEASQSGARSPDKCGRNKRSGRPMAAAATSCHQDFRRRVERPAEPRERRAARLGRRGMKRKAEMRREHQRAFRRGARMAEMTPGISLVPDRYIAVAIRPARQRQTSTPRHPSAPCRHGNRAIRAGQTCRVARDPEAGSRKSGRRAARHRRSCSKRSPMKVGHPCPTAPIWLTGSETIAPVSCPMTQSFGRRNCARRRPNVGFGLRHPGHARGHVAGIDAHGRAPPLLTFRFGRDPRVEGRRGNARARIGPSDRGVHRCCRPGHRTHACSPGSSRRWPR